MTRTTIITVFTALSIVLIQCNKNKKVVSAEVKPSGSKKEVTSKKNDQIIIDQAYTWPGSTDEFELLSAQVAGDSLKLEVRYGGGCKEHVYTMHTNLMYMKSLPPQLNLYLEHDNNNDNCRALITETLAFDIVKLRYSGINQVKLIVNGDREKMVTYVY